MLKCHQVKTIVEREKLFSYAVNRFSRQCNLLSIICMHTVLAFVGNLTNSVSLRWFSYVWVCTSEHHPHPLILPLLLLLSVVAAVLVAMERVYCLSVYVFFLAMVQLDFDFQHHRHRQPSVRNVIQKCIEKRNSLPYFVCCSSSSISLKTFQSDKTFQLQLFALVQSFSIGKYIRYLNAARWKMKRTTEKAFVTNNEMQKFRPWWL